MDNSFDVSVTGVRQTSGPSLSFPPSTTPSQPWMPSSTSNQLFLAMSIKLQASWPSRHSASVHLSISSPLMPHLSFATRLDCGFRGIGCSVRKSSFTAASTVSEDDSGSYLNVQTLGDFPVEKLFGEMVLVRFDSSVLLRGGSNVRDESLEKAVCTINYLCGAGCKVLLASSWGKDSNGNCLSTQFVAGYLSSLLELKVVPSKFQLNEAVDADAILLENISDFVQEQANCPIFSRQLSSGVSIFVNDSFCLSHKVLSSTVGITRFCDTSLAGFQFDLELCQAKEIIETSQSPYIAIIGGGNLSEKAAAIHHLASINDGLVFVGKMAFPIMKCLGVPLPQHLVELSAVEAALQIVQLACEKKIPILFPKDFYCRSDSHNKTLANVPVQELSEGWTPVDIGPRFFDEIASLISHSKKILWIGPVGFDSLQKCINGTKLALTIKNTCCSSCDVTVVGHAACMSFVEMERYPKDYKLIPNAAAVWDFLKGRTLPGVAALDKAYPFKVAWDTVFANPKQPLIVDIGSGNGLFLLEMATKWKRFNFLGLEINKKLVARCLNSVSRSGIKNGHFISTNATSAFRSIVLGYPGELVLVSILCPNPDFNKGEHRWRMLQKGLVQAVADLLVNGGKVFLQSDVKDVAERMKDQFLSHGEGKFAISNDRDRLRFNSGWWLDENPFGIHTDWEQHVVDRGAPMFRLMLSKVEPGGELTTPDCLKTILPQ